jgi:hypothetical protein
LSACRRCNSEEAAPREECAASLGCGGVEPPPCPHGPGDGLPSRPRVDARTNRRWYASEAKESSGRAGVGKAKKAKGKRKKEKGKRKRKKEKKKTRKQENKKKKKKKKENKKKKEKEKKPKKEKKCTRCV